MAGVYFDSEERQAWDWDPRAALGGVPATELITANGINLVFTWTRYG
jgi:hypothetical protein